MSAIRLFPIDPGQVAHVGVSMPEAVARVVKKS
jgi:hypothetical protein